MRAWTDHFQELSSQRLSAATVTLSTPHVEIYSASLTITAQLYGIRYFMYHWFWVSTFIGMLTLGFFQFLVLLAVALWWYFARTTQQDQNADQAPAPAPAPASAPARTPAPEAGVVQEGSEVASPGAADDADAGTAEGGDGTKVEGAVDEAPAAEAPEESETPGAAGGTENAGGAIGVDESNPGSLTSEMQLGAQAEPDATERRIDEAGASEQAGVLEEKSEAATGLRRRVTGDGQVHDNDDE